MKSGKPHTIRMWTHVLTHTYKENNLLITYYQIFCEPVSPLGTVMETLTPPP